MRLMSRTMLAACLVFGLVMSATASFADHGGTIFTQRSTVTDVEDGDTFEVTDDLNGGEVGGTKVRMIGIQAMELKTYAEGKWAGYCNGPQAARRLHELIDNNAYFTDGKSVDLSYMKGNATGLKSRPQRWVSANVGGTMRDIGTIMLQEGFALWFPNRDQYKKNVAYQRAMRTAMKNKVGMWNPTNCDAGPQSSANLKMYVQWDADGPDGSNVNGEFVRIKNITGSAMKLAGWVLRESALRVDHSPDSPLRQFRFPSSGCNGGMTPSATCAVIKPGRFITVHAGSGRNSATKFYWGNKEPIFENPAANGPGHGDGDGAYLFEGTDFKADLRFAAIYPCYKTSCPDKYKGDIVVSKIVGDPEGTDTAYKENVKLRIPASSSAKSVNLQGYLLESWPYSLMFGYNSVLKKGETMTVRVGGTPSKSTRLTKFWGLKNTIFATPGDTARIRTYDNIVLHCRDYGNGKCSNVSSGVALD